MLDSSLHFQRNLEASLKVLKISFYFPEYSVEMQHSSKMLPLLYNCITIMSLIQEDSRGI